MADDSIVKLEESLRIEDEVTVDGSDDDDDDDELQGWDDWEEDDPSDNTQDPDSAASLCLFCDSSFGETRSLFAHCTGAHHFDFHAIRSALGLDFYGSLKLINFVRSQVAENKCWSCGLVCQSKVDLQNHLHETDSLEETKSLFNNDTYLKPFLQDDPLLFSFCEDDDVEDEDTADKVEFRTTTEKFEEISIDTEIRGRVDVASASNNHLIGESSSWKNSVNRLDSKEVEDKPDDKELRAYFPNRCAKDVKFVNEDYFGSYSSFSIHREMLSDKVRMDAYGNAILNNPSLLNNAVVLDVGCGTGILSFFAAKAMASRVIAVEASEKMAAVATRIAKNNGLLRSKCSGDNTVKCSEVVEVVQSMVEDLNKRVDIEPHSVDVLLSEWMGYCLLYESMLGSVLFARDRWLKPGGAILPDTATIIVAGFGKGGTSLPFWENVYGINMSCVGDELVDDAARFPIVDTVEGHNIVTNSAVLKTFDLVTMKPDEVDFTASVVLEPNLSSAQDNTTSEPQTNLCYGAVLWFETGFTSRFCKEMQTVLSTSPFTPKTHWYQTILTFREPIPIASGNSDVNRSSPIGINHCPVARINLRISIARASQHRSIDISVEPSGIGMDGRKRSWPVQFFNL